MADRRALGLVALLVGCGGPEEREPGPKDTTPPTAHWMADTFPEGSDDALGHILLPGAFNSSSFACDSANGISPDSPSTVLALWGEDDAADDTIRQRIVDWARTQGRPIDEQLSDGIRFLELNLTVRDGELLTWHSVYGVPVDDVLDPIVAFSLAQPDEVVVLTFGLTVDPADWGLLADALTAPRADGQSLCDRVYDGTEDAAAATLADLRASGRNVVWAPTGELRDWLVANTDCPHSSGGTVRRWSITDTPAGVEAALADSVDSRDPDQLLVNDFVFSLDGSENGAAQAQYILGYAGVQEASVELGFAGDFPTRLIEAYDGSANMNIFAGAWYQDTTLVQAVIDRNAAR